VKEIEPHKQMVMKNKINKNLFYFTIIKLKKLSIMFKPLTIVYYVIDMKCVKK